MRTFAPAALLVLAVAAPASAAIKAPELPMDCVRQYFLVAEPAPRPVRIDEGGTVSVHPEDLTDKIGRDVNRTTTFVACLT